MDNILYIYIYKTLVLGFLPGLRSDSTVPSGPGSAVYPQQGRTEPGHLNRAGIWSLSLLVMQSLGAEDLLKYLTNHSLIHSVTPPF